MDIINTIIQHEAGLINQEILRKVRISLKIRVFKNIHYLDDMVFKTKLSVTELNPNVSG